MTGRRVSVLLFLLACAGQVEGGHRLDPALQSLPPGAEQPVPVIVRVAAPAMDDGWLGAADAEDRRKRTQEQLEPIIGAMKTLPGITGIRPFLLQPSFAAMATSRGIAALLERPDVAFVEADDRWPLHTAEGLDIIGAAYLQLFGFTGSGAAVAIIDTGIDAHHPTLGSADIPNNKVVRGLDTADGDADPSDCHGHGTAVASIAAGLSFQWSPEQTFAGGTAPSAKILAYKAAPDSDCSVLLESAVVAAIEDAIVHREGDDYTLAAINISGGGGLWDGPCDADNPTIADAVAAANAVGIAVVASSGNGGSSQGVTAPACIEDVISVASVWDQNPTETGSSFCLDPACAVTCNDRKKRVAEPTCYSNTGRPLDLFAPSEYLTVAEARGQFVAFGGTSGAAPYVTGAIALLKRAFPRLPPEHVRLALAAAGQPLTDSRNGLSRPILDVADALEIGDLAFGDAVGVDVPRASPGIFRSSASVSDFGPIGGVRVFLRLSYPNPSGLEIRLLSPSDRSITLQAVDAEPQSAGGLFGCYPHDLIPAESLDALIGSERHGDWVLEVRYQDNEAYSATLESWAVKFDELAAPATPPQTGSIFLPAAARGPGAASTYWTTDIRLHNTSRYNLAEGSLYFIPEGENGTANFIRRPVTVPAGVTVNLRDVVNRTFGLDAAAGQVLVETGDRPLMVTAKIETHSPNGGFFGQFVATDHVQENRRVVLLNLLGGPEFRTNIGVTETFGAHASATITLHDAASGAALGEPLVVEIEPFSLHRIDRVLESAGVAQGTEVYAVVESEGHVLAWASVVDRTTGDAVFFPGLVPSSAIHFVVPVVARAPGREGTRWRSDVRVASFAEQPIELVLELRPLGPTPVAVATTTITVEPGTVATLHDIVGTTFAQGDAVASLRVLPTPASAEVAIVSRTFNATDAGTYGQHIPAVAAGLNDRATILHVDGSNDRRTNFIVCEVGGQALQLVFGLRDEQGLAIGDSHLIALGPFEMMQVTDVFAAAGIPPQMNCRIDIQHVDGDGTYAALASVVDNLTGDAIAVPATALID